jgi:hypothetical protein
MPCSSLWIADKIFHHVEPMIISVTIDNRQEALNPLAGSVAIMPAP